VYPGYIRTPIHQAARAHGLGLEGAVPPERIEDAVRTLVRAALGRPLRDLATTRRGSIGYALARYAPRRWVDRAIGLRARRAARAGLFDESLLAREFVARARG